MSMVFCRGCGKQIHDSAVACPQCGAPQAAPSADGSAGIPDGVKGWSWGAFLLNWIWAIGNRTWIGLLAIVPYIGFVVAIWLGFKGREMAWKNGRWDDIAHFQRVQKRWSQWAVGLTVGVAAIGILAAIAIPAYGDYQRRAHAAAAAAEEPRLQLQLEQEEAPVERSAAQQVATESESAPTGHVIARADFQQRVDGRSAQEVLGAFGQPEQTQDIGGMQIWYYSGITRDPVTDNVDGMVQVMFRNGYVQQVSFF